LPGEFHDLLGDLSVHVDSERLLRLSLPARSGGILRQV
jgi:hypothetical protein